MVPGLLDHLHRKAMILLRNAPNYVIKLNGALFDFRFVNFTVFTPNLLYSVQTVKKTEVRKTAKQLGHSRFTNFEILCFQFAKRRLKRVVI